MNHNFNSAARIIGLAAFALLISTAIPAQTDETRSDDPVLSKAGAAYWQQQIQAYAKYLD